MFEIDKIQIVLLQLLIVIFVIRKYCVTLGYITLCDKSKGLKMYDNVSSLQPNGCSAAHSINSGKGYHAVQQE